MKGQNLKKILDEEITSYKLGLSNANHDLCFKHLGRAHIISQRNVLLHLYVHKLMLQYSFSRKDMKEVAGQVLRLIVTVPGHILGKAPHGNIGWATVGLVQTMPLPDDLKEILK